MKHSITIVGGGLSGLALAHGLVVRGVNVRVIEAGTYPRHRVCGEFINGVDQETLGNLGLKGVLDDALRVSETQWFCQGRMICESGLDRPALALSRYVLDARLRDLVKNAGGEVRTGERVGVSQGDGWVNAAGRRRDPSGEWSGLKCHLGDLSLPLRLEMHLGSGAYVGLTPIEGGKVNLCGLFPAAALRGLGKGRDLLLGALRRHELADLAGRVEAGGVDESSIVGVSGLSLGWQRSMAEGCALGDASSVIPPFTGNGMSMAFESAESALEPLVRYASGKVDWTLACAGVQDRLDERFRDRLNLAGTLHPMVTSPGGQKVLSLLARFELIPFNLMQRILS